MKSGRMKILNRRHCCLHDGAFPHQVQTYAPRLIALGWVLLPKALLFLHLARFQEQ